MHSFTKPTTLFTLIHLITIGICRDLQISCPNTHGAALQSANQFLSHAEINALSLDSSCFAMDIRLNVENILPDPSYISRETNVDIIYNALQKTLSDSNINGVNIISMDDKSTSWSINNRCPQEKDETVNKFYLEKRPHNIICDEKTLKIGANIECEFSTPDSIAYIFNIDSITSSIQMTGFNIVLDAVIMNSTRSTIVESDTTIVPNPNPNFMQKLFFEFSKPALLIANRTYRISIRVVSGTQVKLESVPVVPTIITSADPNACYFAFMLSDDEQMVFALESLCSMNTLESRQIFEQVFYQQHSSQNFISALSYRHPKGVRRRLKRKYVSNDDEDPESVPSPSEVPKSRRKGKSSRNSLHLVYSNSTIDLIANDYIFPNFGQCMAIDQDKFRLFSIGGSDPISGLAKERLAVYKIYSELDNAYLLQDNLVLDRARSGSMCYYYRNMLNNQEYIIVINGMDVRNDMNINNWYNDITFTPVMPLHPFSNVGNIPEITLKHNVIDMTPVVTETNELYLFGGRDNNNAQNYIQILDLNQILDPNNDRNEFMTMERMEPMLFNRVTPFIDFPVLDNKTCIMIFGGQNYINNEWIDIETYSNNKLQLYCNDNLVKTHFNYYPYNHTFTAFDRVNLKNIEHFETVKATNNIFINDYNFGNNDIIYEFSVTFKVCFNEIYDNQQLTSILNLFDKNVLGQNILTESQRIFKRWNDGFSVVNILDIDIITMESTQVNQCAGLSQPVCESLVIASSTNSTINGDQECKYNTQTRNCYAIQRRGAKIDNVERYAPFESITQSKLYPIVAAMFGVVMAMILFIIGALIYVYTKRQKQNDIVHEAVALELDMMDTESINTNINTDHVRDR